MSKKPTDVKHIYADSFAIAAGENVRFVVGIGDRGIGDNPAVEPDWHAGVAMSRRMARSFAIHMLAVLDDTEGESMPEPVELRPAGN